MDENEKIHVDEQHNIYNVWDIVPHHFVRDEILRDRLYELGYDKSLRLSDSELQDLQSVYEKHHDFDKVCIS